MWNIVHLETVKFIEFNGKKYKTKEIDIKGYGTVTIATESLEKELMKDDKFVSAEAQAIDDDIFFYVEDEYINLDGKHLGDYVKKQL